MAHSFIYVKNNRNTERTVGVWDSVLRTFMIFFNDISKRNATPNGIETEICGHYHMELLEWHTSFMEAMLQEVYDDSELKSWYLSILLLMESKLDDLNEYIDNNYLNQLIQSQGLDDNYPQPVKVFFIKTLIYDIYWVLAERETPSNYYKWFEDNIPNESD
ncbi:MAG TPA: hypothetical protein VIM89_10500 [Mucilaginibacter sp.]